MEMSILQLSREKTFLTLIFGLLILSKIYIQRNIENALLRRISINLLFSPKLQFTVSAC